MDWGGTAAGELVGEAAQLAEEASRKAEVRGAGVVVAMDLEGRGTADSAVGREEGGSTLNPQGQAAAAAEAAVGGMVGKRSSEPTARYSQGRYNPYKGPPGCRTCMCARQSSSHIPEWRCTYSHRQ